MFSIMNNELIAQELILQMKKGPFLIIKKTRSTLKLVAKSHNNRHAIETLPDML